MKIGRKARGRRYDKQRRELISEMQIFVEIAAALGEEQYGSVHAYAKAAGVSSTTLYDLLNGNVLLPRMMTLQLLASAVGLMLFQDDHGQLKVSLAPAA